MKRVFPVALACLIAGLLFAPASAAAPILVVYPLAIAGSVPAAMGQAFADRVATEVTAAGGISVVHGDTAAKPAEYRTAAKAAGATVYFSGSIAPVGSRFAAIEQLVSTKGGIVVWSQTIQFQTLADLNGEGTRIRDTLLHNSPAEPAQQPVQPPQ
jgi:TolB-like protein